MKEKYEKAKGFKKTQETIIQGLICDVESLFNFVNTRMREIECCKSRLETIALRYDPLSTVDYLDLMIQEEDKERHLGFEQRIKTLNEYRQMALFEKDIDNFNEEFQLTKEQMASYGIALNQKDATKQGIDFINHLFYSQTQGSVFKKK